MQSKRVEADQEKETTEYKSYTSRPNLLTTSFFLLALTAGSAKAETTESTETASEMCLFSQRVTLQPSYAYPDFRFFEVKTEKDFEDTVNHYKEHNRDIGQLLLLQERTWKNTAVHLNLANHQYEMANRLIDLADSHNKGTALRQQQDVNKCTPFIFNLQLAGPDNTTLKLQSPESIRIPTIAKATPLMYQVRGVNPKITNATLEALKEMGPETLKAELDAVDDNGRTVDDWSNMSREDLLKEFEKVEVDGTKAANHCYNSFFANTDYMPFHTKLVKAVEQGKLYHSQGGKVIIIPTIKATLANAKELIRIANGKSKAAQASREAIYAEAAKSSPVTVKNIDKFWKKISDEANRLAKSLSSISLVDLFISRQEANRELLRQARVWLAAALQNTVTTQRRLSIEL